MTDSAKQPPVYFSSLELENVRCFGQPQTLSLTDEEGHPAQWTLILGDNGVGKTTLLQCLAWMRPLPRVDDDGEIIAFVPALNNEEENSALVSLMRVGTVVDVTLEAKLTIGRRLGSGETEAIHGEVTTEISMQGRNGLLETMAIRQTEPEEFTQNLPSALTLFAYGATRRSGIRKLDRGGLIDPLASLFDGETALYDAEDVLLKLDHRARISEAPQDVDCLQRIKEIIATVLPDIRCADDIKVVGPVVFDEPTERNGVQFATPYGTVPLSALSVGYQTTLTWVTDLALRLYERYPESSEPLSEPGIVLIDDIELHLHPLWQRRMIKDISRCFPAIQFVATSHSPLVVQAAEGGNLAVLRESDGEALIDMRTESVSAWRADQILASELFGIPSRSRSIEMLIEQRNSLLDRTDRQPGDETSLRLLEEKLDKLRTAEDPKDQAAMDLIRTVAEKLKDGGWNDS